MAKKEEKTEIFPLGMQVKLHNEKKDYIFSYIEKVEEPFLFIDSIIRVSNAGDFYGQSLTGQFQIRNTNYMFSCRIMGDEMLTFRQQCTKLLITSQPKAVEQRDAFRFETIYDVEVRLIKQAKDKDQQVFDTEEGETEHIGNKKTDWVRCQGLDLSDAGLGFATSRFHELGEIIECRLTIKDARITHPAKVVRVIERTDEVGKRQYRIGAMFENLEDRLSKHIRQHIYKLQTKKR